MTRPTLAAALAASLTGAATPPILANREPVITPRDYAEASAGDDAGIVTASVTVDAAGRPQACRVTETSGHPRLDRATCALLRRRARFEPARDAAGRAVEGVYVKSTSYGTDSRQPSTLLATSISVDRLPVDYRQPARADVEFDGTGALVACRIDLSSGSAAADATACSWAAKNMRIAPPKSGSDAPALAHRRLIFVFTAAPPA
jgi:TonB family protein